MDTYLDQMRKINPEMDVGNGLKSSSSSHKVFEQGSSNEVSQHSSNVAVSACRVQHTNLSKFKCMQKSTEHTGAHK